MNGHRILIIAAIFFSASTIAAETDEIRSTLNDQQSVAVTIYNTNLALVKDQRKIKLKSGLNNLALRDVSAQIRPETALLSSLSNDFRSLGDEFSFGGGNLYIEHGFFRVC